MGNPESERKAEFYQQPWCHEAVPRYFYSKVCKAVLYTHTCKRSVILHDYVYIYIYVAIYILVLFFVSGRWLRGKQSWNKLWA